MILSASRRTDIPAFYSVWLMNRFREGYVYVRNPMNYHQISNISLNPQVIDCIVFWTKNAAPLLPHIDEIGEKYKFYFQYTLNAYDKQIEQGLSPLSKRINTFIELSSKIGPERIHWRYDPILLTEQKGVSWHIEQFHSIASQLKGYTNTCVFSYIDLYEKVKNNISGLGIRSCIHEEMETIALAFSSIAKANNLILETCAEEIDLAKFCIEHGHCIDGGLIEKLTGRKLNAKKDKNQREVCGCLESIDIGQYNTCLHGCKYCYANFNPQSVRTFSMMHDPESPLLIGRPGTYDKITERKMKSQLGESAEQMSMF